MHYTADFTRGLGEIKRGLEQPIDVINSWEIRCNSHILLQLVSV
jgi:hypothetical protein